MFQAKVVDNLEQDATADKTYNRANPISSRIIWWAQPVPPRIPFALLGLLKMRPNRDQGGRSVQRTVDGFC